MVADGSYKHSIVIEANMGCCDIYNQSFYNDISNLDSTTVPGNFPKLSQLRSLFKGFEPGMSGIWQPAIILPGQSSINYVDIFRRSESVDTILDPCNCSDINEEDAPFEEQMLDCEYCNKTDPINNTVEWSIADSKTGKSFGPITSTYCEGANDVRMYPDDYLTKLPVLNNTYLTGIYDFKYLDQFPATSNHNLGWEEFISIPLSANTSKSLSSSAKLVVDWNICEKIGEIEPNDVDSYHVTIDDHNKSYNRHLNTTKTCGNFILIKPDTAYDNSGIYPRYPQLDNAIGKINNQQLSFNQLPRPEFFTKPYGFKNQDFYNIFSSGHNKIGSHWKWNYTSGIICWYRYAETDIPADKDSRVFPGIDIYIPDGDVFFAKNQGPEKATTSPTSSNGVKNCPSGIKLISTDKKVSGVIPENSEFIYISENLYNKAYSVFYKLDELESKLNIPDNLKKTPKEKLEIACILATAPNYDEITVDLLEKNPPETGYIRNVYNQIDIFNTHMLKKGIDRSSNTLNLIKNRKDLFHTLINKYGSYIWIPPQTTASINLQQSQIPNLSIDIDFQPVINKKDIITNVNASGQKDCNQTTISREYYYDQTFSAGANQLNTKKDAGFVNRSCNSGQFLPIGSVITASVYHSNSLVKSFAYSSGSINFNNTYLRPVSYDLALKIVGEIALCSVGYLCNKSLAVKYNNENNTFGTQLEYTEGEFKDDSIKLNRGYAASFFNPNINLCAFHQDGGAYFDSNVFGNNNLVFNKSLQISQSTETISVTFATKDVGIKVYSLNIQKLRNKQNPECKTLPLDLACKCFPLKQINDFKYNCDGSTTYTNAGRVLFTPNLSTHNSPDIKAYGDFSVQEIVDRYGKNIVIPNHIGNKGIFPVLSKKIDPINPYECAKNISINLPNYTKTVWQLSLDKYLTGGHTDVWATVSETVDLFRSIIFTDPEDIIYDHITSAIGARSSSAGGGLGTLFGGFSYDPFSEQDREQDAITEEEQTEIYEPINNPYYRRYTNEVVMNNKSFYNRQTKILFDSDNSPTPLVIEIKNPFLIELAKAAGNDGEAILYTPLPCSLDGTPSNPISPLPNSPWLTSVNVTFHQQPRKQVLMYQMYPLKSMGTLSPGLFHPNSGLKPGRAGQTSLVFDRDKCYYDFDYERKLFQKNESYSISGSMYYSKLNKEHQSVLDTISSLSSHKKLRLYINAFGIWYEYLNPHIFGFYNKYNHNLYPGAAAYFEYTNYDKPKALLDHTIPPKDALDTRSKILITKPSPLIPASAKINIPFNYIVPSKILSNNRITYPRFLDSFYPNIPTSFKRGFIDPKSIVIDSIRPYFFFDEESLHLDIGSPIENLSPDDERIGFGTVVLDDKKDYWKYTGGLKNDKYSYESLGERSYYDNNFSSLHFVFNNDFITKNGIVSNSYAKIKSKQIILFDSKDATFNTSIPYTVVGKYLIAEIVDKYGNKIDADNPLARRVLDKKYIKISTALVLDLCEDCRVSFENGYVTFPNSDLRNSITIYQKLRPGSLYKEYNELLVNRKANYLTKWGDLINYDLNNNPDLNDSLYIDSYIDEHYPFHNHIDRYNNLADSLILNQLSTGINRLYFSYNTFTSSGFPDRIQNQLFNYSGLTNYIQHQKYHSDTNNIYEFHTDVYDNFIPLFDMIFTDDNIKTSSLYNATTINTINNVSTTGTIFISGLRQFATTGILSYQDPPGIEIVKDIPINPFEIRADQDSYMIVSLDDETSIRPIIFNRQFYYPTPRVDDTYFPFLNNNYSTSQGGTGCVSFTKPNILYSIDNGTPYFNYAGFNQITNNIQRPYFVYPIYCDNDAAPECGINYGCRYQTAGGAVLSSEYQHLEYLPKKFKDIRGQSYQYVLSSDEGLYNILHGDQTEFPYIQRFEIPPSDEIFNQLSSDQAGLEGFFKWTDYSVENRKIAPKYSYIDSLFQTKLLGYKNTEHTSLVSTTDQIANEMLFRLIHGTKQHINIDTIKKRTIEDAIDFDEKQNAWSYLLQYADIKTKPEKIYDLIPYDYSIQSDQSRRKINGSISIEGVPSIGARFSAQIGNKTVSFNVQDINGTIYLVASQGGKEAKVILGYLYQVSETLLAVAINEGQPIQVPTPPDQNTTITQVGRCNGGQPSKSWSAGQYFSEMRYTSIDENGEPIEIDMVEEYEKCVGMMIPPYNCISVPPGAKYPDASVVARNTTFPAGRCPNVCDTCDSRGYLRDITAPEGCVIAKKSKRSIKVGGIGRGTFGNDTELNIGCPPRNFGISLTPGLLRGDFDAFGGGTPVLGMASSLNCNQKSEPCSVYCHPIGGTDKFGEIFNPLRIGAITNMGGLPCECRVPQYGYCSAARNSCDPCVPHLATNFTYNFENLYSRFSSNGHIVKINKSDPIIHNGIVTPLAVCGGPLGLTPSPDNKNAQGSETCFWLECTGPKPPSYIIYKSITKTPGQYNPLCPTTLVNINYDNNTTKVSLIGMTNALLCFENTIRNDCPTLTINLPNNTFSFIDTIESECSTCDVEPNIIDMDLQNPPWEIVTEERIAVIGTLAIEGDINEDVVGGGGQVSGPNEVCNPQPGDCCWDACYKTESAGGYQCGKDAPDSWTWQYVLNCELNGSPDPSFAPCISEFSAPRGTLQSVLVNGKSRIGFAAGSHNKDIKYRHKQYWETLMTEIYQDIHICQNNPNLNVNDIVEGVVPGSCGELKFTTINFPATAYRQTLDGGTTTSTSYGVDVAYYIYKYRRPKTIEDILLDYHFYNCQTKLNTAGAGPHSPFSTHNMTEKYGVKSEDCQTTPVCYDNIVSLCDAGNFCCQVGKPNLQ